MKKSSAFASWCNHFLLVFCLIWAGVANGQSIGIGTDTPDSSAVLDINSTQQGLLVPRMGSYDRNFIVAPATGLLVFDTDTKSFWYYKGTDEGWFEMELAPSIGFAPEGVESYISDEDENTTVDVETTTNEDVIRFNVFGTEVMNISKNENEQPLISFPNVKHP